MSTIKVNAIQNTSGVEVYTAKAWVNFNGTGTVAIRSAGGVSSISDNGVNDYTLNFSAALADALYCVVSSGAYWDSTTPASSPNPIGPKLSSASAFVAKTVSAVRIHSGAPTDYSDINVAIFR